MYIWGKGRAAGRVGSDFFVRNRGSGQRFAESGQVGSGPRKVARGQLWDIIVVLQFILMFTSLYHHYLFCKSLMHHGYYAKSVTKYFAKLT